MALVEADEAIVLRELFAGLDAADESDAASAMNKAAIFLRWHDLSFRRIVQETEARGLLLPSKVGAAIQLMDSATLSEAESALAGARRLMKSCGLTFAGVIAALGREPAKAEEIEQLKFAYEIEVERSRELAAELQFLRANAVDLDSQPVGRRFKPVLVVATLVLGIVLATSIVSTIGDLFRAANAAGPPHGSTMAQRVIDRLSASRSNSNCWRDRSIHPPCF